MSVRAVKVALEDARDAVREADSRSPGSAREAASTRAALSASLDAQRLLVSELERLQRRVAELEQAVPRFVAGV